MVRSVCALKEKAGCLYTALKGVKESGSDQTTQHFQPISNKDRGPANPMPGEGDWQGGFRC